MKPFCLNLLSLFLFLFVCNHTGHSQDYYPQAHSIVILNPAGEFLHSIAVPGKPLDIDRLPDGGFCVSTGDGFLQQYDRDGNPGAKLRIIPAEDVDYIGTDTFLLSSRGARQVLIFNSSTHKTDVLPFSVVQPSDADQLANGNYLVCDAQGQTIKEFTPEGSVVWEYNQGLTQPLDALRLNNGNTLISDFDNHRVLEVSPEKEIINNFTGFNHPQKLHALNEYEILVADSDNQRLVKLNLNGEKFIIRNGLNYILSAVFLPEQKLYACVVNNRFLPPDDANVTTTTPLKETNTTASVFTLSFDRYYFFCFALLSGLVLWFSRSHAEWACLLFVFYYAALFGVGYLCITEAASQYPYQPGWLFYAVVLALAAGTATHIIRTFIPKESWINHTKKFTLPFSWITLVLLIITTFGSLFTQYYHSVGAVSGWKLSWYWPMLLWAASIYIYFRHFLYGGQSKAESAAPFTTGSVNEDEDESNYVLTHPTATVNSPEWRQYAAPIFMITLVLAGLLYTIGATHIPTDVHGDEAEVALHGIQVRDSGNWNIFNLGWYMIPNLFFLIPAWGMWLFGDNLLGIRLTGAIIGIASIPMFYLLAKRIMVPTSAATATFLFAVSTYFIHYSRLGIGYNQATLITVTVLYFVIKGVQEKDSFSISMAGFIAGVGILSYQAAKVVAPVAVLSIILLTVFRALSIKQGLKMTVVFCVGVWITAAPLIGNFLKDPAAISSRTNAVSIFHEDGRRYMRYNYPASYTMADIVKEQFRRTALAPITNQDNSPYMTNKQQGGLLDPIPALLFSAGLITLPLLIWHPAGWLLILWYIMLLYPASALTNGAPTYQRLVCVYPVLILITAPVLAAVFSQAASRLRRIPYIKPALLGTILIFILLMGMNRYFHQIMSVPQMLDDHTRVARHLHETGPTVYTYKIGTDRFSIQYGTIRFLAPKARGMDVSNPNQFLQTKISRTGPIQFLFVGRDVRYVDEVVDKYPGGKLEYHRNSQDQNPFVTYQITR